MAKWSVVGIRLLSVTKMALLYMLFNIDQYPLMTDCLTRNCNSCFHRQPGYNRRAGRANSQTGLRTQSQNSPQDRFCYHEHCNGIDAAWVTKVMVIVTSSTQQQAQPQYSRCCGCLPAHSPGIGR